MHNQEEKQIGAATRMAQQQDDKSYVSERKIQANRQNALRSTGPRTARGKRTVSFNAITHGLLAREVVITAGDGKESVSDFINLVERLCEHYEPVGVIERMHVETIAICWWRKARVIRAENGGIRRDLDSIRSKRLGYSGERENLAQV